MDDSAIRYALGLALCQLSDAVVGIKNVYDDVRIPKGIDITSIIPMPLDKWLCEIGAEIAELSNY